MRNNKKIRVITRILLLQWPCLYCNKRLFPINWIFFIDCQNSHKSFKWMCFSRQPPRFIIFMCIFIHKLERFRDVPFQSYGTNSTTILTVLEIDNNKLNWVRKRSIFKKSILRIMYLVYFGFNNVPEIEFHKSVNIKTNYTKAQNPMRGPHRTIYVKLPFPYGILRILLYI